jgi:hypothetical protein
MAEQPGVQGLHAAEVRNLDEFRMPRLGVHKATPQDQGTTVLARPETIALLHYPGRRRQTEGGPPTISRKRLASPQKRKLFGSPSLPTQPLSVAWSLACGLPLQWCAMSHWTWLAAMRSTPDRPPYRGQVNRDASPDTESAGSSLWRRPEHAACR